MTSRYRVDSISLFTNLVLGAVVASATGKQPQGRPEDQPDVVCGPRCVREVLDQFGRDVELIQLVREMQFPDIDKGSSLGDIQRALTSRGLFVLAVDVSSTTMIRWNGPVIAHSHQAGRELGHFSCLLTSPTASGVVLGEEVPNATGAILLISKHPIDSASALSSLVETRPSDALWLTSSFVTACLALYTIASKRSYSA